ncbi:MAG: hypothetical protein JO276_03465 [Sphingomonadaceae bacterium]|nr:hypothetical protein [Sphingomonadaceae bacterium]
MSRFLQRFDDPETERAFLRAERGERSPAIRALILIAAATLLSYIFINPLHFPSAGVAAYDRAAGVLILQLAGFWLLTRTAFYPAQPWVDLPVFAALAGGMIWLALVLAELAPFTGFPPHVMVMVQLAILVVFASVGFAGTFRLFLPWALAILALFAAWLAARDGLPEISRIYTLTNFSTFLIFALYFNWDVDRRARKVFAATVALETERAKTEELLYNVLPKEVAARLRAGEAVADSFAALTAIFVDLAGFSTLAKQLPPGRLVELLNAFFSAADRCAERHGLEKVKTIGDAYLAVLGGTSSNPGSQPGSHGQAALRFARDLIAELVALEEASGIIVKARIGIHSGPAVGGVIGTKRLAYDYWGDTMNVASRLQAVAPLNGVAVSEATHAEAMAIQKFEAHKVVLKGIGETDAYAARLDPRERQREGETWPE